MAKAKTAQKKTPAKKTPAKKAPPTKKAAPTKAAAKPSVIDVEQLDAARDDEAPDASAKALADHAEALAATVKAKRAKLARAKVTADDGLRLTALAATLRAKETVWRNLWRASGDGAVTAAREPAKKARAQIFSALRVFANKSQATQSALDDIAGVENDADLLSDLDRLVTLAGTHRAELAGTDTDESFVAGAAKAADAFRAARAGNREPGGLNVVELSDEAIAARRARNRVFWALADLDREVCQRGTHAFLDDERGQKLFAAYTHRAHKPKAPPPAAPPKG